MREELVMGRRASVILLLLVLTGALLPGGFARPAAAEPVRFRIQTEASQLTFKATSRLMNADGKFHRFRGEVLADPKDLATARVTLTVEAASIDTNITRRDNHLRSEDFFHAERYPTITFESIRVEPAGGRLTLVGRLTVRGVTREVAVPVDVEVGDSTLVARGAFDLRRTEYGITYNSLMNPIGEVVRVAFTFRARAS
jgi:polyisoprenoid-binding protein YceI